MNVKITVHYVFHIYVTLVYTGSSAGPRPTIISYFAIYSLPNKMECISVLKLWWDITYCYFKKITLQRFGGLLCVLLHAELVWTRRNKGIWTSIQLEVTSSSEAGTKYFLQNSGRIEEWSVELFSRKRRSKHIDA